MADNKIANAIKFLKGEEKSLPATKTEGQVYFAYKNVGTAEKPSYTGAIYIDTPIGGTQNRIKMTANADIADKAFNDSAGLSIRDTYLSSLGYTDDGKQTILIKGSGNNQTRIALPIASTTKSGIITTDAQSFGGTKTFTTINSTNLTITGTSGFSYTGIETATGDKARPVWFAYDGINGKPVVNTNFTYNPATQTLKVANLSGTADKATKDSAGNDIRNTYVSDVTISGRTITVTKGSGVKVTLTTQDTDTWRGIQNNLTSDSTTDSLSAAQGKYLKSLIDGKSNNGHNHDDRYYTEAEINSKLANYLPLIGGTITGALNFANSTWNVVGDDVAIGDMDIAGTLGVMGKNGNTSIKLVQYGASTTSGEATPGVAWTCTGNGASTISGTLTGTFSGSLSGNASSANKATNDGVNQNIANTYIKDVVINKNIMTITKGSGATSTLNVKDKLYSRDYIATKDDLDNFIETNVFKFGHINAIEGYNGLEKNDGIILSSSWKSSTNYGHQIYIDDGSYALRHRYISSGIWSDWASILDSTNYNSYAPTKTGGGASGTWGINISGNAASANKLNTNAGSSARPIYFSGGIPIQCDDTLANSISGNAASATALTSSAGSSTQPVYFSGGKPVACAYTLSKSVPADAKFTDTWRPLGTTGDTACAGNDSRLSNARPASDVYSWAKASTKPNYSWGEITGKPSTFTPSNHTHYSLSTIGDQRATATTPDNYSNTFIFQGLKDNGTIGITSTDTYSYVLGLRGWADYTGGDSHELAFNSTLGILTRSGGTTWNAWRRILDSANYTEYTVTKSGSGASGTWGINVTGSAGSVAWGNVSGRPSSMPASDVYSWAKASSKPSYSWDEITNKPSTFNPSSHTHPYLPLSGGTMTGTINFTANQLACNFRPDASGYCTGIMHQTSGDEALMFAAANAVTSFIFKCGQNPVGMTSTTWTGITPSMQIKKQSVYINSLIANNVPPSYNLYVNGTTRCNGTLGVGNGSSAEIDFFPNSSSTIGAKIVAYNDRIEFVFG